MKILELLVLLLAINIVTAEQFQLFSASTFLDSNSGSLSGSLFGGRTIYIKGIGLPTDPTLIKVMIGNYPCIVPADGLTPTIISCQTSSVGGITYLSNLPIQVVYNDQIYAVPGYTFTYQFSDTPDITDVYPSASVGNRMLNFYGQHRVLNAGDGVRDIGDFIGIWTGNQLCAMFDIQQGTITYNGVSRVQCLQARLQEAGKYNVSEHVVAGWAYKEWYLRKPSLQKQYYEHTVLPAISSVSANQGAITGQDLVITGSGFSLTKSKVSVSVDGVNCVVSDSTLTSISCRLAAKQPTNTAALSSSAGMPVNNFISGSGFYYRRYNVTNLSSRNINGFKAAVTAGSSQIQLLQSGHATQLQTKDILGTNYGQVFQGYFYAPVSGSYIFRAGADDIFSLMMSTDSGTTGSILNQIIYQTSSAYSQDNYYISNYASALGTPINLQAGKYYYMKAYHVNWVGPGFFKVSVQVPNTDTSLIKQRFEVNRLQTSFTNDPQIMTFTLDGVAGGTFNLSIYRTDPVTLQVTYNKQVTINYNASPSQFQNALNQFDLYSSYGITCTGVQVLDDTGSPTTANSGTGITYTWTVSVYNLRPASILSQRFTFRANGLVAAPGKTPSFSQIRTHNHCPLIQGTFTLSVGGTPIRVWNSTSNSYSVSNIPYNITRWDLQAAFRQIPALARTQIFRINDPSYGSTWIISYLEYNGNVPDLVLSGSRLTGGLSGTSPRIAFVESRGYSSNIIFNPVNQKFLFMGSPKPNIIVTVNSIQSVCLTDCTYTFLSNIPTVNAQSLTGSIVQIGITNPTAIAYTTSMLNIKIDGQPCQIITGGTFSLFTCQLIKNTDNSPILKAGDYNVQVNLDQIGILKIQAGVNPMNYPLVVSSVTSNSGGMNGGYNAVIQGKGFPSLIADARVQICGVNAVITSITNIQTIIVVPQCATSGQQTITYYYNGQTGTTQFTYLTAASPSSIISISPRSASPVLKAVMTITGTGFGTNLAAVKSYLANSTGRVYQMRILSVNDTVIRCGIPGGLPGNFSVVVTIDGIGDILPTSPSVVQFIYQLTVVSVSPSTVAYHGGTLITITGRNFSPEILQNLVYIGNQLNWLCSIQNLTTTQIICRVPPTHPDWTSSTQGIVVGNRLILDSTCTGTCSITYSDNTTSPNITSVSYSQLISGTGSINIYGNNLDLAACTDIRVIFQNKLTNLRTYVTPTGCTANMIIFSTPFIQAGTYQVRARLDPVGQTNSHQVDVRGNVNTTPLGGSLKGGLINIVGNGLPSTWPSPLFSIKILSNTIYYDPIVVSTSPTKLVLKVGPGFVNQSYSITIINPIKQSFTISFIQYQSATPAINLLTTSPKTMGAQAIQLNRTTFTIINPDVIQVYNVLNPQVTMNVPTWTTSGSILNFNFIFNPGQYGFKVLYNNYGYADIPQTINISASGTYTATSTDSSFAGGRITVTGNNISPQSIIKVGGFIGKLLSQTASQAIFQIPPLVTPVILQTYPDLGIVQKIIPASIISDSPLTQDFSFDNRHATFYTSNNTLCYIGLDVGIQRLVNVKRIRYFPNYKWNVAANYIKDAIFQGSTDGTNYVQIGVIDQTVHAGWNSFLVNNNTNYRYVRLRHSNVSQCMLAQFQVYGITYNDLPVSNAVSYTTNAIFTDGFNQVILSQVIAYKASVTPIISTVNPPTGSIYGNQVITITGQNLNYASATILVDQIACTVNTAVSTSTNLQCTTQDRPDLPNQNTFKVRIGTNVAIIRSQFIYVMRWSDIRTWGTDLPPVQGDLVYVPKGMALYVDQSTPRLDGIVVQDGKIIFADQSDIQIHTNLITINRGQFRAGTQAKPYQHQLKFIMYGSYYGKQQPMFGNKGIGCMECKFSMHGKPRTKTWTVLSATINAGDTVLTVADTVDWQVGQQIVIASTDFDHNQAQQRTITAISGSQITVNTPFVYKHLGIVENYGTFDKLQMRAEVGLLTRNIKMMGDPTSAQGQYGSHLMMAGAAEKGMVSHIAYTQFTHCGQPRIVGRYCIHFHMNGDVSDSFAKGNAVHHSFARVITIHGIQFLRVSQNVGYRVKGHNFFIEDGIETQNVIENNLAIGSLQSWNMMQTDISVASYWVTNPSNHLRFNRAAGGDFYGFWYQIKDHPDGPSATADVCPVGNPLGESHDNVAHSYKRFGLRIFKLYARQKPCLSIRQDWLEDPWSQNPSIQSKFYNYVTYKNGEDGLLAEYTGNCLFENFTIADSKRSAMQFLKTNYTKERVVAKNMAIIGVSRNGQSSINQLNNSAGVIAPRTVGWEMTNVRFYNFAPFMNVFQTCAKCDQPLLYTNVAHEYLVSGVSYTNISSSYLKFGGMKRNIIYDLDATFSAPFNGGTRTSATIVYNFPHIATQSGCTSPTEPTRWDDGLVCDQTVPIRAVTFTNLRQITIFSKMPMKIQRIADVYEVVESNSTSFGEFYSLDYDMEPMDQMKKSYSVAFVAGRVYNIWWLTGLDFTHLNIDVSKFFLNTDPAIIFKFNYTQHRQYFEVGHFILGQVVNYTTATVNTTLDQTTCQFGDFTHDVDNRTMTLCATSRGLIRKYQYLDVVGVRCKYICPTQLDQFVKQNFIRLWSNATQWPGGVLPSAGEDILIPGQWTVLVDIQPAPIGYLLIRGDVFVPDTNLNVVIQAQNIWIMSGSLNAGTSSTPYPGKLTIKLNGNKNDVGIVIDPQVAGNKMLAITGKLQLFGPIPTTTWTKLTAFARPGDTTINVISTAGWQIGDELAIAPSFSSATQHEKVTITAINGNTVTFTPALIYKHYGAANPTVTNAVGTLDTRTGVGHLSRNIKIVAGPDSGWGFQLLVYGYIDNTTLRSGSVILNGVQLVEGGQYDTQNAAVKILNAVTVKPVSITGSTFFDCKAVCLDIQNINNAEIKKNVFYKGRLFHVRANKFNNYAFQNNLMIAATKRPTVLFSELIACYATYDDIHYLTASIKNNLCQGSDNHGFVLPYLPCNFTGTSPIEDNTAGSAFIGQIFNKINGTCQKAPNAKAYGCTICHMQSSPGTHQIIYENFMVADCGRGLTIRFGGGKDDSTGYLRNSYVAAISRPTCTQCYGADATACSDSRGVRMLTVTVNGQTLPAMFGRDFDIVCKSQTFDCKAFIDDVIFENFNINYPGLPQCSNNSVFEPHKLASDITGSHHLHNTVCNNCDVDALARFTPPLLEHFGWSGGCGRIHCTGKNNYLIQDYTGHFLGTPGFLLANNSQIGDNTQGCVFNPTMNGHICQRLDYSVIQYESIAPDFNTRIMWPVYLKFDGGVWNTSTNGWREWQWDGLEPLNRRLGRFVSVVQVNQVYNMTFESEPPIDMRFQFQRRTLTGNISQYIVIKMHYPRPNSIRVEVAGETVKPISLLDNNGQSGLNLTRCGSNKFFYQNYTIHFVLTAQLGCQVRVSLTNSIQLTARFSMDINSFFANDGVTKFIDRMCAVLGIIDTSRLKVVGIYNGSVTIKAYIDQLSNTTVDNASQNNNTQQKIQIMELQKRLSAVYENGELSTAFTNASLGPLIDFQSQAYYHTYDQEQTPTEQQLAKLEQLKTSLVIGVSAGAAALLLAIIAAVVYIKKKPTEIANFSTQKTQMKIQETSHDVPYSTDDWNIKK